MPCCVTLTVARRARGRVRAPPKMRDTFGHWGADDPGRRGGGGRKEGARVNLAQSPSTPLRGAPRLRAPYATVTLVAPPPRPHAFPLGCALLAVGCHAIRPLPPSPAVLFLMPTPLFSSPSQSSPYPPPPPPTDHLWRPPLTGMRRQRARRPALRPPTTPLAGGHQRGTRPPLDSTRPTQVVIN